jgi:hypothetical protein
MMFTAQITKSIKVKTMKTKSIITLVAIMALAVPSVSQAQHTEAIRD